MTDYVFDQRNRLTSVERRSAGGVILSAVSYRYDGFGRLIERDMNGFVLRTVHVEGHAWADLSSTNTVIARYLLGDGSDELLARWRPSDGFAWYLTDHQGTIRQLMNGSGTAVINTIQYTAFGEIVSQTNPSASDRFAYTGREWESAAGLYYYRARFYDPGTARFISQDPIGFEAGDPNLYRYVGNTITDATDPSGLAALSERAVKTKINAIYRKALKCLGDLASTTLLEQGVYMWASNSLVYAGKSSGIGDGIGNRMNAHKATLAKLQQEVRYKVRKGLPRADDKFRKQVEQYLINRLREIFGSASNFKVKNVRNPAKLNPIKCP